MPGYKPREYREAAEACVRDGEADIALRYFVETGLVKPEDLRIGDIAVQNLLIRQSEYQPARKKDLLPRRVAAGLAIGVTALSLGVVEITNQGSAPKRHGHFNKVGLITGADGQTAYSGNKSVSNPNNQDETGISATGPNRMNNTNNNSITISLTN